MTLTLREKRDIVRRFKSGESIYVICFDMRGADEFLCKGDDEEYEDAIRDFMNGKFKLAANARNQQKCPHGKFDPCGACIRQLLREQ